jgi:multidrug resistance efflux pump
MRVWFYRHLSAVKGATSLGNTTRVGLLLATAYLIGTLACSGARADLPADDTTKTGFEELRVRRGSFRERVLLTGILEATQAVRITPPRTPTWRVQIRWMEEDGTHVKAGQKILELDNAAFATDLDEERLAVRKEEKELQQQKAQADARAAEIAFTVAERRVELQKAQIETDVPKELIPLREYQEKQLALERARTAMTKTEDELATHIRTAEQDLAVRHINLEKSRYDIRIAEKAVTELVLEAPRDGVLIIGDVRRENRKLQVGDTVWPGYVVARLPDLNEMQVVARLSDVDDGNLRAGMTAIVRLDGYPEFSFPGVVNDITPVAQGTSSRSLRRAFRVRVTLEQTDAERMRPGMAAQVEVQALELEDVLLVPRAALDFSSSPPKALLENGEAVPVELGPCNGLECVSEGGIEEGVALQRRTGP